MPTTCRKRSRVAALVFVLAVLVVGVTTPAGANEVPGPPRTAGELAEIALLPPTGPGLTMTVLVSPVGAIDPLAGYPATDPAGATGESAFTGVILAERRPVVPSSPQLQLYCVQVRIETSSGVGYVRRPWADVENLGYVAQILANYYPFTGEPAALANDDQRAAAVQAAIWFFTDGVVVPQTNPTIRNATAAIVANVLQLGPLTEPGPPDISIVPPSATTDVGGLAGPFTIQANGPVVLTTSGGQLFADAVGTVPLPSPVTLPDGSQFWVRSDQVGSVDLSIRGEATIPQGSQYFFDGGDPTLDDAQRLILAQVAVADTTAMATATFATPTTTTTTTTTTSTTTPASTTPAPTIGPATPAAHGRTAGRLPATGPAWPGGTIPLAITGVALITAGGSLTGVARRRRGRVVPFR